MLCHQPDSLKRDYFSHQPTVNADFYNSFSDAGDRPDLRILLVGKSGAGISTAGNTILGEEVFVSRTGSASVTTRCNRGRRDYLGREIAVVDTPGFCHTTLDKKEIKKEIERCAVLSLPGPHAIVVVMEAGRCTKEEEKTAKRILKLFGKEVELFLIVLFTHEGEFEGESVKSFVKKTKGKHRKLIDASQGRYLSFNSIATRREKKEQRRQLIDKIDRMVGANGGCFFHHQIYKDAEKAFKKKQKEIFASLVDVGSQVRGVDVQNMAELALTEYKVKCPVKVSAGARQGFLSGAKVGRRIGDALAGTQGSIAGALIGGAVGSVAGAARAAIRRVCKK